VYSVTALFLSCTRWQHFSIPSAHFSFTASTRSSITNSSLYLVAFLDDI
jgi:hypothetical protein